MNIAIIPARGGSKRIPRKNIKKFADKPMIAHSIECACQANLFDRIIVSTDDDEISGVAKEHGAEVPFKRPADLSDDKTGIIDVVAHAIDWLQENNESASAVCCIYATAPFVRGEDVKRGLELLNSGDWHYVLSATTFAFPIARSFQLNAGGGLEMFFPEHFNTRSQDLPEAWHDAGQFCWGRSHAWLERRKIFDKNSTIVPIPRWRVQDIDTFEDWERAQVMWQVLQSIDEG